MHDLIAQTEEASDALGKSREGARTEAIRAIRELERQLVDALGGETLKGLRQLADDYSGARVRCAATDPDGYFCELPLPVQEEAFGREVLVLSVSGRLEMARRAREGAWLEPGVRSDGETEHRPAEDGELLAEDAEQLVRLLTAILPVHVERARRSAEKFARAEELARKISGVLGE